VGGKSRWMRGDRFGLRALQYALASRLEEDQHCQCLRAKKYFPLRGGYEPEKYLI